MDNFDFSHLYGTLKTSVISTNKCEKHNPLLLISVGCVVGGIFGGFILPFSLGGIAATVFHHEFANCDPKSSDKKEE